MPLPLTFPIVLLIAGAALILLAVSKDIRIKDHGLTIAGGTRLVCGVLGVLMAVAAVVLYLAELRQRAAAPPLQTVVTQTTTTAAPPPAPAPQPGDPAALIRIIKRAQKDNVRESRGESKKDAFTDDDLKRFQETNVPERVVLELRTDEEFRAIVRAIAAMDPAKRAKLLSVAATTARPTFEELRGISTAGQTDAGHQADLLIAQAIVELVKREGRIP